MDLRLVRAFLAIVESGTVSSAATRLNQSQPALSRQVHRLERDLGVVLLERQGRRLVLSSAGKQFLPLARDLLQRAEHVEREASAIASGRLSHVSLAVPTTTLADILAPFLATWASTDPVPSVRELDPHDATQALGAGADLAIVTKRPEPGLVQRPLAVLPILAHLRPEDPWAGQSTVSLAQLATRDLVLLTRAFKSRTLLDAAMDVAGLEYQSVIECGHALVALAISAGGERLAVLSDDAAFGSHPVPVVGPSGPVQLRLFAAWQPSHHAAATLGNLADRLAAFCVERYGESVRPPADSAVEVR